MSCNLKPRDRNRVSVRCSSNDRCKKQHEKIPVRFRDVDFVDTIQHASQVYDYIPPEPMHQIRDGWGPQTFGREDCFIFTWRDVSKTSLVVFIGGSFDFGQERAKHRPRRTEMPRAKSTCLYF